MEANEKLYTFNKNFSNTWSWNTFPNLSCLRKIFYSQRKILKKCRYGILRIKITVNFDVRTQTELRISLKAKGLISLTISISWFLFNVLICSLPQSGRETLNTEKSYWCACFCFHSPPEICPIRFHLTKRRDFRFETNFVLFDFDICIFFRSVEKGSKRKVYQMLRTNGIFYWRHKKLIMPLWSESLFPVPEMFQYVFTKWKYFTKAFTFL